MDKEILEKRYAITEKELNRLLNYLNDLLKGRVVTSAMANKGGGLDINITSKGTSTIWNNVGIFKIEPLFKNVIVTEVKQYEYDFVSSIEDLKFKNENVLLTVTDMRTIITEKGDEGWEYIDSISQPLGQTLIFRRWTGMFVKVAEKVDY